MLTTILLATLAVWGTHPRSSCIGPISSRDSCIVGTFPAGTAPYTVALCPPDINSNPGGVYYGTFPIITGTSYVIMGYSIYSPVVQAAASPNFRNGRFTVEIKDSSGTPYGYTTQTLMYGGWATPSAFTGFINASQFFCAS